MLLHLHVGLRRCHLLMLVHVNAHLLLHPCSLLLQPKSHTHLLHPTLSMLRSIAVKIREPFEIQAMKWALLRV